MHYGIRLGHLSNSRMTLLHYDFPFIGLDQEGVCDVCHLAKQKKLPYQRSFNKAMKPFDLIHFDIWGPLAIKFVRGFSYFLTAVEDFSRYIWVTLMRSKAEVSQHVMNFVQLIETQHNTIVKTIRTDNDLEFLMPSFYSSKGSIHQKSCVESPQQNGRVERKHQHILNVVRSLLFHSNLPKQFWCYAVSHVVFIIKCVSSPLLENKSPYFLMHD